MDKLYTIINDGVTAKEALEDVAKGMTERIGQLRDTEPWVSLGLLSDAQHLANEINKIVGQIEALYTENTVAQLADEYQKLTYLSDIEGFLDKEKAT